MIDVTSEGEKNTEAAGYCKHFRGLFPKHISYKKQSNGNPIEENQSIKKEKEKKRSLYNKDESLPTEVEALQEQFSRQLPLNIHNLYTGD